MRAIPGSPKRSHEMQMPSLNLNLGRRSGADVVGLDIQPGFVAAVQARVNGSIVGERAGALPLAAETVRDGEVADVSSLSAALRELFASTGLSKRVRIGGANQRTVRPRRGGGVHGAGPGSDAALQRGARLPCAWRDRHTQWPASEGRARGRSARH